MVEQARWHLRRRQDEVRRARFDRTDRHSVELGGRGILHERETGCGADRREPERAICSGAGEHDSGGEALPFAGERAEEEIDRKMRNSAQPDRLDVQHLPVEIYVVPARFDVDVIRFDAGLLADLAHRHRCALRENLGKHAVTGGSLVAHDDERDAAVGGKRREQLAQRRERAG